MVCWEEKKCRKGGKLVSWNDGKMEEIWVAGLQGGKVKG